MAVKNFFDHISIIYALIAKVAAASSSVSPVKFERDTIIRIIIGVISPLNLFLLPLQSELPKRLNMLYSKHNFSRFQSHFRELCPFTYLFSWKIIDFFLAFRDIGKYLVCTKIGSCCNVVTIDACMLHTKFEYKLALTCFKSKSANYPSYISDLLVPYTPSRSLRSSSSNNFSIPRIHLKGFGERAFTFSGPSVWNALRQELKSCSTLGHFKKQMKTHLFRKYLN